MLSDEYNGCCMHRVYIFFFRVPSHFNMGSMSLMRLLHLTRSCASSPDSSLSVKLFLRLSNHLRMCRPLLRFSGTSININLLPTYSSSHLNTCPYHFNLLSCSFLDISPTCAMPVFISFLILSNLMTPLIHHNILIQLLLLCFLHCPSLGTVHHCWSYNRLVYFPLTIRYIHLALSIHG